ncbi:MAG: hypothetical protein ACRDX9_01445 [Acidimicrobiia bacterium]
MGWIAFLMILALSLTGVGLVVETLRWLLVIGVLALITGGLIGWSRREELRSSHHLRV